MAMKIPTEITCDNVSQVCDALNKQARRIKRRLLARKLVLTIGCLCFVAMSMMIYLGGVYQMCEGAERSAVAAIPVLGALSVYAEDMIFRTDLSVGGLVVMLVGLQYLIPIVVGIVATVAAAAFCHPAPAVTADQEPERARQMGKTVQLIYNDWINVSDKSKFRIFCNYLFTVISAGILVLQMVAVGGVTLDFYTILGGVVVFVLLHLIYKLLLGIYVGICKLFFNCKNPVSESLRTGVSSYLRQVDPTAAKEERSSPATTSAASRSQAEIVHIDSFTWTESYVRSNEEKCGDTAMNYVEIARDFLRERDYAGAAASLDRAAYALELLSRVPGGAHYIPYLYANQYAASRVYAFGLRDRSAAKFRLEQAVTNAGEFALKQLDGYERAIRDFKVMNGVLEEFNNGTSLSTLTEYYGSEFPYDIING